MTDNEEIQELRGEVSALRERLSLLGQASLRITGDLDLDAVLQEVVDGARSLTGASRGCLIVLDESGQLEFFLASGITEEERQQIYTMPGGMEFFHYLVAMPEPFRGADFSTLPRRWASPNWGLPWGR